VIPVGPLLIKSGGFSTNPSLPDMQFVRTFREGLGETLYIPGSSLKGVFRSFVEKALRTINDTSSWKRACPTFEGKDDGQEPNCTQRIKKDHAKAEGKEKVEIKSWDIYRESCGACRIFGNTLLKGRLAFTDLLSTGDVKTETRYGVAISRLSHAVAQGPFEMEVAVSGAFDGQVILENYELWQLGLLATAIESMNQGIIKVGFGKNRGLGQVNVTVKNAIVEEIAPIKADTTLRGLGDFVDDLERSKYGLSEPFALENVPQPEKNEKLGFYQVRSYNSEEWGKISRTAIQAL
jgi:CRISPR-associated RAMP protein (TIGR02581 family)